MTDERNLREAELARLADGSLPAERQEQLRAQVQQSPELAAKLSEQERAVTMLRAVDAPAPDALRARVEALTGAPAHGRAGAADARTGAASPRRSAARWRRVLALPVVVAVAVVVAILVAGSPAPTVPQTARVALAAATLPAPVVDHARPGRLRMAVAGVSFPNWERSLGWTATGARSDTIDGRRIKTVFYRRADGARVGYAIVSGAPLHGVDGTRLTRYGVDFTVARAGHARLITWVRSGHTCVIAGEHVGETTLVALAAGEQRPDGHERAALYEHAA